MKKFLILILICYVQNTFSQYKEPIIKVDPDAVINKSEEIPTVDTTPEFMEDRKLYTMIFLRKIIRCLT